MKKTLFAKLITVLIAVCAVAFVVTACNFGSSEEESSSSVSSFYEQSESTFWENSSSLEDSSISEDTSSEDSSSAEDSSGGEDEEENGLQFNTIQIENNAGSISVSNSTDRFSFKEEITIMGRTNFVVALDEFGISTSVTKIVPLSVGNNEVYVFEMLDDEVVNSFVITIRRRPIYTVTFKTNGGSAIQSQQVEEGSLAVIPEENPTKNGYEFASWAFDFSSPIMQTTSISANWSVITYSITYDLAGGCFEGELTTEYTIESNFSLQTPSRENYEFLGWYDGNTKITTLNGNYGNKTLTAKWESIFNYSNGVITGLKSRYQNLTQIVIPEEINGEAITSIGEGAFSNCNSLTSIEIPDSVTSIGASAFGYCSSLTSVEIPNSVTSIGVGSFEDCESLQYNVKDNLNYLGNETNPYLYIAGITSQDITSANIDNSCKFIGYWVFSNCSSLTSVVIGDSVTSIGSMAFSNCSSLTSVVIGNSVTSIGSMAFSNCSSLTSIEIPDSVTSIGASAFASCSSLTSIVIPNSVISIGPVAFEDCDSLEYNVKDNLNYLGNETNPYLYLSGVASQDITSANMDNSCKFIGNYAFSCCSSLTSVGIGDSVTSIGNWAFSCCSSLTSVVIPDSVTSIGSYAFYGCNSLTSVVIPDSVTSIDNDAFSSCESLTSVVIPDSVTSIGERVFEDCSLTSVVIPDSVTSIGERAFEDCSLTSVVIGDSVTSIGDYAFYNCDKLVEVVNKSSHITVSKGSSSNGYVGYYALSVSNRDDSYVSKLNTDENGYITYSDGLEVILVGYIGSEKDLILPSNITKINQYAFASCYSLTSVVIGDSVTSIGDYAFYSCYSLTSVVIGDGVTSIGYSAFDGCSSLTSVVIGDSVTSIGDYAFYDCDSLTSIEIPDSVTSIGDYAFYSCYSLISVVIGDGVTSIGYCAFEHCYSLTSIKYRGTKEEWNAISKGYDWDYNTGNYTVTYDYTGE